LRAGADARNALDALRAGVGAGTAVLGVAEEVDARARARSQARIAVGGTAAVAADLERTAGATAHAAVGGIAGQADALVAAERFARITRNGATAVDGGGVMSIVSDIIFIARYGDKIQNIPAKQLRKFADARQFIFPYLITFHTGNLPGTTGFITTAIGKQEINIETVSHNRYAGEKAIFSIATMPCTLVQIEMAIEEIKNEKPGMLLSDPKIMPILY